MDHLTVDTKSPEVRHAMEALGFVDSDFIQK